MRIIYISFNILFIFLAGCADSHQLIKLNSVASVKLNESGSVYVAVPTDGAYGSINYHGSGINTAQIIQSAFFRKVQHVEVAQKHEKISKAMEYAKNKNFEYLVVPTILHWEDRATEWSAIPDQVEVKIEIIELSSGRTIVSGIAKGKSGIATLGGDHPQDLLPKPIEEFVTSLY